MEQILKNKENIRIILAYEFKCGLNASQAARKINKALGKGTIGASTARNWFSRFNKGIFDVHDLPRTGRPVDFDEAHLEALLQNESRQSTRELAEQIGCHHSTVADHLEKIGKVQKWGSWVPHYLNEKNKNQRLSACASLISRYRRAVQGHRPFLNLIVTGDEKWCLYVNVKHRKQWVNKEDHAIPRIKASLHPLKVLLSVWWDVKGIIHFELLPRNKTITAAMYVEQLRRLAKAIEEKRPNLQNHVILQHDNARPHTAKMTKLVIDELGWEVLDHPPYSPDLAPSDFHLFRAISNGLRKKKFDNEAELKNWLNNWFGSKGSEFFSRGIKKLPHRWEEVINNGGEYIVD